MVVSAVIGTHCKSLTSDERVLENGTAFITDNGMVGSTISVGGFDAANEVEKIMSAIPRRSKESWSGLEMQGAIVEIGDDNKAIDIKRIRIGCENPTRVNK